MFVDSLLSDDPNECIEGRHEWHRIQQAIERLDGRMLTEVSIAKRGTESHMSISGGGGVYLVSATLDNDVFFDLRNPLGDPTVKTRVVSGGQAVTVGMDEAVDCEIALQIAKAFAESGVIDSTQIWLRTPPN